MKDIVNSGFGKDLDILRTLVRREFRIRYKDSFLGILWVFGAPLLMIATYSMFMFGIVRSLGGGGQGYTNLAGLWLCLGLWQWLSESTIRATSVFHDNAAMVKKTPLKLSLLPLTNVIVSSVGFLLPLVLALLLASIKGSAWPSFGCVAMALVAILPWFVGLSFFASILGTFLRDAKYAIPLCFNVGMFLSPILYSREQAPSLIRPFLDMNPLGHQFEFLKAALSGATAYPDTGVAISTAAGLAFMIASMKLFSARNSEFADVV
jgi:ABC-type polysaccharide/polyol phosphate export permease|nr:ABC transporter permease [Neorhizobium tomejilense]